MKKLAKKITKKLVKKAIKKKSKKVTKNKIIRKICRNPSKKLLQILKSQSLINDKYYIIAFDRNNSRIKYDIIKWKLKDQKQFTDGTEILISNGELISYNNIIEIYGPFECEVDAREWLS
jgi:hypothetical protein